MQLSAAQAAERTSKEIVFLGLGALVGLALLTWISLAPLPGILRTALWVYTFVLLGSAWVLTALCSRILDRHPWNLENLL